MKHFVLPYSIHVVMTFFLMKCYRWIDTLRLRQYGCHFKCLFLNENVWILTKNSLKFVPKGKLNNIPALVQIRAWHRPGAKPLSDPWWLYAYMCHAVSMSWLNRKCVVPGGNGPPVLPQSDIYIIDQPPMATGCKSWCPPISTRNNTTCASQYWINSLHPC